MTDLICGLHCVFIPRGWLSLVLLAPPSSTGCPMTEGLHPPSDPWGSAGSMAQPGYSPMMGNSPHMSQHGPFTAINPQDRLVSSALTSSHLFVYEDRMRSLPCFDLCIVESFDLVVHLKHRISLLPRNGNHFRSLRKTIPYMAVKSMGLILQVSTPAPVALGYTTTRHLLLALRP